MSTTSTGPVVAPRRVIVGGPGSWVSAAAIREALRSAWGDGDAVLVTGRYPSGADRVAEFLWRRWGGQVERSGGRWDLHGRGGARPARESERRRRGADMHLMFSRDGALGAGHTVRLAENPGLHPDGSARFAELRRGPSNAAHAAMSRASVAHARVAASRAHAVRVRESATEAAADYAGRAEHWRPDIGQGLEQGIERETERDIDREATL